MLEVMLKLGIIYLFASLYVIKGSINKKLVTIISIISFIVLMIELIALIIFII